MFKFTESDYAAVLKFSDQNLKLLQSFVTLLIFKIADGDDTITKLKWSWIRADLQKKLFLLTSFLSETNSLVRIQDIKYSSRMKKYFIDTVWHNLI